MFPIPKLELTAASLKLIVAVACALALALLIHDRNRWKAKTTHYAELLSAERGAHAATIANYRAASETARRADVANRERVISAQAGINERTIHDYEARLGDARTVAERLRRGTAAADRGGGGAKAVPAAGPAARAAGGPAAEAGFSVTERLIATEQAIQLDELIKWVKAQGAVDNQGRDGSIPRVDSR